MSVLCQYPADLAREALSEVSAMHGDGVREALLDTARRPGGIVLRGEVDVSNHDVLHCAVQAATRWAADSLVVDLRLLDFLDVSGARALLGGTKSYRHERRSRPAAGTTAPGQPGARPAVAWTRQEV